MNKSAPGFAGVTKAKHARISGGLLVPHRVGGPRRWWDWVLAADPGLANAQAGWRALVTMPVALAVGYGMSYVLDVGVRQGTLAAGLVGALSAYAIAENTAKRLTRSLLWMPIPYGVLLPLASWLTPHRAAEQGAMVVALALSFFLIRFGPLGVPTLSSTLAVFVTTVIADIRLNNCAQFFVVIVATMVSILAARLLLCYPTPRENLLRAQRAFLIEARRVADAAAAALDPDGDRVVAVKRMRHALRRLRVTTLTIDGHLAQPEVAADPHMAELLHQHLFDAELALQGIGEAIERLAQRPANSRLREAMVIALIMARDTRLGRADALSPAAELIRQHAAAMSETMNAGETEDRALALRVGNLLDVLADALARWHQVGRSSSTTRAKVPFQPTVALEGNRPVGAGPAARRVVTARDGQGWRRVIVYLRLPLQVGVAAAIASSVADAISPQRFYWAVLPVVFNFMGTVTTHDRLRRLAHRIVGTAIGAVIGIALLHLIGPGNIYWTLATVVVGLAVGIWSAPRAYAYWVVCLTVALVQVYGLITPYRDMNWLLTQRLIDSGLGMGLAVACTAVIFPLPTREVAREAQRGYLAALEQLIARTTMGWKDADAPVRLRGAARGVDAALFQVQSVLRPVIRMPTGVRGRNSENLLALLGTATGHARALAAAANTDIDIEPLLYVRLERITQVFIDSLHALDRNVATDERCGTWFRTSAMIRELQSTLNAPAGPPVNQLHTALGELAALDEVLAGLANDRGMTTTLVPPY